MRDGWSPLVGEVGLGGSREEDESVERCVECCAVCTDPVPAATRTGLLDAPDTADILVTSDRLEPFQNCHI